MLRVRRDPQHGLGRRLEQQVIDDSFVLVGDVGDLGRQREDDVEISNRQQKSKICIKTAALKFKGFFDADVRCTMRA
jgi:hypothetical protein